MSEHDLENDVVFRVWQNGYVANEVIVLWPAVDAGWPRGRFCQAYEHIGQHGAADYRGVVQQSRPAKPTEYAAYNPTSFAAAS